MNENEHRIRQSLSIVWKLVVERITTQALNLPIIDAKSALSIALERVKGANDGGEVGVWMTRNLNMGSGVFTAWFDGVYRNAFREPTDSRFVLCRQLHRLACGQLSRCGHRVLSDAHEMLKQDESGPWAIAWSDLKESGADNV